MTLICLFSDYCCFVVVIVLTAVLGKVIAFNLPDVGEGIQTVEVKEW